MLWQNNTAVISSWIQYCNFWKIMQTGIEIIKKKKEITKHQNKTSTFLNFVFIKPNSRKQQQASTWTMQAFTTLLKCCDHVLHIIRKNNCFKTLHSAWYWRRQLFGNYRAHNKLLSTLANWCLWTEEWVRTIANPVCTTHYSIWADLNLLIHYKKCQADGQLTMSTWH